MPSKEREDLEEETLALLMELTEDDLRLLHDAAAWLVEVQEVGDAV